jgi:alkylation response protein AidB-like acyl-CoA dehydrogenase
VNFTLSAQQEEIQGTLRRYLKDSCSTVRLNGIINGPSDHDTALWRCFAELGILGAALDLDYGGTGLELIDLSLVAEVLGYAAAPGAFLGHSLAGLAIAWAGTDQQKARWLPALADGRLMATVALGEPGDKWLPEQWEVTGTSVLSGSKTAVLGGLEAQLVIVGTQGGGLSVVEFGAPGLIRSAQDAIDRTRRFAGLDFTNVSAEPLPKAAEAVPKLIDAALVLLAADAFGGGTRCVEMAVEYAGNREQFGVKIGEFQALRHQLANMAVEIEPARGLYWYAAHALDQGFPDARRMAAVAKAHLGDRFLRVARNSIEAHGGIGYTWEYPIHIWLKRAMFDSAFLGSSRLHRARSAQMAAW